MLLKKYGIEIVEREQTDGYNEHKSNFPELINLTDELLAIDEDPEHPFNHVFVTRRGNVNNDES